MILVWHHQDNHPILRLQNGMLGEHSCMVTRIDVLLQIGDDAYKAHLKAVTSSKTIRTAHWKSQFVLFLFREVKDSKTCGQMLFVAVCEFFVCV